MSNFKDFSQQGVSGDTQFGKGGGRIVFKDGVFHLVSTPNGTDLSRLKVSAPTESDDAVTLDVMTTAVNHVYSKLDKISASLVTETTTLATNLASLETTINAVGETRHDTIVSPDGAHKVVAGPDAVHVSSPMVIGDGTTDGMIQPEAGHSLTIAGGDADVAGSILIRAGQGATPGHVEIHDLADPVHAQDAATLASLTAAIAQAVDTVQTGSTRAVYTNFAEKAGDTMLGKIPAGVLLKCKVVITQAFAAGTSIVVRTSTQTLASETTIDEGQTGTYVVELLQQTLADTLFVTISSTGGNGEGGIVLEYISS